MKKRLTEIEIKFVEKTYKEVKKLRDKENALFYSLIKFLDLSEESHDADILFDKIYNDIKLYYEK
jgi:hypothetical protein